MAWMDRGARAALCAPHDSQEWNENDSKTLWRVGSHAYKVLPREACHLGCDRDNRGIDAMTVNLAVPGKKDD